MYRKLKRTTSHGYLDYIPNFRETFLELSKLDNEELANRFRKLKLQFYYEEKIPVNFWYRLTLPFALITILVMLIGLPINFILTGNWGYPLGKNNRIYNWLKSLNLNL